MRQDILATEPDTRTSNAMKQTLEEILLALRAPVDEQYISQKDTGKYKADFIQHATLRELLDERAPGWETTCQILHAAGRIYVTVGLTIHGSDGPLTRWNVGNEVDSLGTGDYGDPSSNAHAMGLGRVAMDFGLGRDLWMKKKKQQTNRRPPAKPHKRPPAKPHELDIDDYR